MTMILELLNELEECVDCMSYIQTYQVGIAIEIIRDRVEGEEFEKTTQIRKKIGRLL